MRSFFSIRQDGTIQEAAGARQHYLRELNPVETIRQFIRDNWLSNRVFKSYDDILDDRRFALEEAHRYALEDNVHRNIKQWAYRS